MKTGFLAVTFCLLPAIFTWTAPKERVVAVLPAAISENVDKNLVAGVVEIISEQLTATDLLTVVDRTTIDQSLRELELQMSGLVSEDEIKKAGRLLGASHVVVVQVSHLEVQYFISAKMVEVETGVIIAQESGREYDLESSALELAERVGKKLVVDVTGGEIFGDVFRLSVDAGFSSFEFDPDLPLEATLHDTHPDDSTFMYGSPGTTPLDVASANFLDLALSCGIRSADKKTMFVLEYVFKLPVAVIGRSMHQNDNDTRPPENGSYVYTKILNDFMPSHELGLGIRRYIAGNFYAYAVACGGFWDMRFETGWYRFGTDQAQASFPSSGPGLGFTAGIAFNPLPKLVLKLDAAYRLIWLTYPDYPLIPVKMPQGFQIGGSVEYIIF
jgi:TolB-like protein